MTVEQIDKIDFLSVEKETGFVKLTISDHLNWLDENNHLVLLQKKINTYISFIEGGELFEKYPENKGKTIIIYLALKYEPTKKAYIFLDKVKSATIDAGFDFKFNLIK